MNQYQLGKKEHKPDDRDLKLKKYMNTAELPDPPDRIGHDKLIQHDAWGMLGNDEYGDCVWAGAAHETMLWQLYGHKRPVSFTSVGVLSDYAAVTGFTPNDPATDQGTYTREALDYRRTTGIVDSEGLRHTIEAYVALTPGDVDQLWLALWLFGAVSIGFSFPDTAMEQFQMGERWHVEPMARIEGGHYVPAVARRNGIHVVTWGKEQDMSKEFYKEYCDEAYVALSTEMLDAGVSIEGFDADTLRRDLQEITA